MNPNQSEESQPEDSSVFETPEEMKSAAEQIAEIASQPMTIETFKKVTDNILKTLRTANEAYQATKDKHDASNQDLFDDLAKVRAETSARRDPKPEKSDSLEDEIYEMLLTPGMPSKGQFRRDMEKLIKLLKKKKLKPKHLRQYGKVLAEQFGAEKPKKLFSKKPPSSSPLFGEGKPPKKGGVKIPKKVINDLKKDKELKMALEFSGKDVMEELVDLKMDTLKEVQEKISKEAYEAFDAILSPEAKSLAQKFKESEASS